MADPATTPDAQLQSDDTAHTVPTPPTEDDLPYEDGVPMETSKHRAQMELLIGSLSLHLADRDDVFIGGNMFLYFSALQTKRNDFRGPDFFVVLGTDPRLRKSWVMWQEAKAPDVIVELTSPSTRDEDYGRKKTIYGQSLRVPHYFLFDPLTGHLDGFDLSLGKLDYVPLQPDPDGRLRCERLDLSLGVSDIQHRGQPGPWLRWFTPEGELVATYDELAAQETARADEAGARADEAAARAQQEAEARRAADVRVAELEAQLRALRGE